jgi:hypothetical protein
MGSGSGGVKAYVDTGERFVRAPWSPSTAHARPAPDAKRGGPVGPPRAMRTVLLPDEAYLPVGWLGTTPVGMLLVPGFEVELGVEVELGFEVEPGFEVELGWFVEP